MPAVILKLSSQAETINALSALLIEAVADGAGMSFMHPLSPAMATTFWADSLARAARGERIVLGAYVDDELVGSVTLITDLPQNQPHRAEIAKMVTRRSLRGRGIGGALLRAAEAAALAQGRWLLVLDTAEDGGATAFYEALGYIYAGTLPQYALTPHGALTGTRLYWKDLRAGAMAAAV